MSHTIEQAVFTSAETNRTAGYQLVAATEGMADEDARTLSTWGPSHDSLLDSGPGASSLNFHGLPSGCFCVSRTTVAGNEYSGRGTRIYTQSLVLHAETFSQFANDAFAVARAATGRGVWTQHANVPKRLETVQLSGRSRSVDSSLLAKARHKLGPATIARLMDGALDSPSLAVTGLAESELAIGALLNCLPPAARTDFSFSTGLKASSRRPFRLVALGGGHGQARRLRPAQGQTLLDLTAEDRPPFDPQHVWSRVVLLVLRLGRYSLLDRAFAAEPTSLDALGDQLLRQLDDAFAGQEGRHTTRSDGQSTARPTIVQQAHAAHDRFEGPRDSTETTLERPPGPATHMEVDSPAAAALLQQFDDLVGDAVTGDVASQQALEQIWPKLREELDAEQINLWQEQYLRYAIALWRQNADASPYRPTDHTLAVLDVLGTLFDQA